MIFSGGIERDQWHIMIKWVNQVFLITLSGYFLGGLAQEVLFDRIEHEYLYYCSNLILMIVLFVSDSRKCFVLLAYLGTI